MDGSVNFDRDFKDYEEGFEDTDGDTDGEFWLGMISLFILIFRYKDIAASGASRLLCFILYKLCLM